LLLQVVEYDIPCNERKGKHVSIYKDLIHGDIVLAAAETKGCSSNKKHIETFNTFIAVF
jgi:hypothetical protein